MDHDDYPSGDPDTKQVECPDCDGVGKVPIMDDSPCLEFEPCDKCKGTGTIEIPLDEYHDQRRDDEADLNRDC